jgi:hypothetical protein
MRINKIHFRQSGGFAGLVRGSDVSDEKDISAADRRALERYAQGTRAASPAGASRARDLVMYELELDTDAGHVRLEFDESNVPDDLAALVHKLAKRAKPMPP